MSISNEVARIIAETAQRSAAGTAEGFSAAVETITDLTTQLRKGVVVQDTTVIAKAIAEALLQGLSVGLPDIKLEQAVETPKVENQIDVEIQTEAIATAISDLFALDLRPDMSPLAEPFEMLSASLDRVAEVGKTQEKALNEQMLAMLQLSKSNLVLSAAVTTAAGTIAEAIKAPVVVERDSTGVTQLRKN